jgi:uncharacterized protein YjlB
MAETNKIIATLLSLTVAKEIAGVTANGDGGTQVSVDGSDVSMLDIETTARRLQKSADLAFRAAR